MKTGGWDQLSLTAVVVGFNGGSFGGYSPDLHEIFCRVPHDGNGRLLYVYIYYLYIGSIYIYLPIYMACCFILYGRN